MEKHSWRVSIEEVRKDCMQCDLAPHEYGSETDYCPSCSRVVVEKVEDSAVFVVGFFDTLGEAMAKADQIRIDERRRW